MLVDVVLILEYPSLLGNVGCAKDDPEPVGTPAPAPDGKFAVLDPIPTSADEELGKLISFQDIRFRCARLSQLGNSTFLRVICLTLKLYA